MHNLITYNGNIKHEFYLIVNLVICLIFLTFFNKLYSNLRIIHLLNKYIYKLFILYLIFPDLILFN